MARNIANLVVTVTANTGQASGNLNVLAMQVNNFGSSFAGVSAKAVAMGTVIGNALTSIASKVYEAGQAFVSFGVGFVTAAVNASTKLNNALLGLTSVAKFYGISADEATEASRKLSEDGLIPLQTSALGLKNLIATGFNLKQSIDLMNAFKDSAVFLRQEHYTLARAVETATEGLRNSRSVQVDNAGITKNLSVILAEYGYRLQDLSDATKGAAARQALYTGIMREAAAQQGLAAASLKTFAGATVAVSAAWTNLLATLGHAITRNQAVMIGVNAVGEALRHLDRWFRENKQTIADWVTGALVLAVRGLAHLLDALAWVKGACDSLDTAFRQLAYGFAWSVNEIVASWPNEFFNRFNKTGKALLMVEPHIREVILAFGEMKVKTEDSMRRMKEGMDRNEASTKKWSDTLGGLSKWLRTVADDMNATKGSLLRLDIAGTGITAADLPSVAVESAADKRKRLAAEKKFRDLMAKAGAHRIGLSSLPGQQFDIDALFPQELKLLALLDKIRPTIREGLSSLPGTAISGAQMKTWAYRTFYDPIAEVFRTLKTELPNLILDAFAADSLGVAVAGIAANLGGIFSKKFAEVVKVRKELGESLSSSEKLLGYAGVGLEAFAGGYGLGASSGRLRGALGGAASGALAGATVGGPIGAVVGGVAGLFGGIFGGGKKAAEERRALAEAKQALLDQYGGLQKLRKLAADLGVNIQQAFDTKKPEEFERVVKRLNTAIEDQKRRLEALSGATEGVNARAAAFAAQFASTFEALTKAREAGDQAGIASATAKLAETAQRTQGEFERLGLMVRDTFAGMVRESGDAIAAITALDPAFKVLQQSVNEFGLTNSAVTDELLANYNLVTNEAFKPLFEAIRADGQVLRGLFDAKALSPEGFQAIAEDIGASIKGIIDAGGDMQRTLALSQPTLQALWEAQQRFGAITDENTLALLKEAEAQGIVGQSMKETNKQILDVLIAIGDALGAKIPEAMRGTRRAAEDAAEGIEQAFSGIEVPPIVIPVSYGDPGAIPAYGTGGIVTRPTLALVGESGPEAIIPLTGERLGVSGGNTYVTDVYLDGEKIARNTAKKLPGVLRGLGV